MSETRSVVPDVIHNDLPGTSYPTYYDARFDDQQKGHKSNSSFKVNINFNERPVQGEANMTYGSKSYKVNRDDTYVKASDVNALQDSIMAVQRTIGCTATGLDLSKTFMERFNDLYNYLRMDGATAKGRDDNGTFYNTSDNRYIWGSNTAGVVTSQHSINKHVHNGVVSPKVDFGNSIHVQGTIETARMNFSRQSEVNTFIHAGLLKYDATGATTLHQEIGRKLDKEEGNSKQTVKGPIEFINNVRLNMMQEEDAYKFTKGSNLLIESNDSRAWSGKSIKIPSNKNASTNNDWYMNNVFNIRYGRYNSAWRIRVAGLNEATFTAYKDQNLFTLRAIKNVNGSQKILGIENVTLRKLFGGVYNQVLCDEYSQVYLDFINEYIPGQTTKGVFLELTNITNGLPFNMFVDSITAFPMGLSAYDE